MSIFYKRLLIIGIAIGIFCSMIVFTSGQTQLISLKIRNNILNSNLLKLVLQHEENTTYGIGLDEANQIQELLDENYVSDMEISTFSTSVFYQGEPLLASVLGTGVNYASLMKLNLIEGRYFTKEELEDNQKVCVLKSSIYDLIKSKAATHISINGEDYKIIGVFSEASSNIQEYERDICIPATTLYKYVEELSFESGLVNHIVIDRGNTTKEEVLDFITKKIKQNNLHLEGLTILPYHYEKYLNQNNFIQEFLIYFLIASLILIIATFNIVHIATASALDREREIGLKTAIGATPQQIIKQICLEILTCSLKGGLLGITFISVFNTISNHNFGRYVFSFNLYSILVGFLLATFAGLIASILPARKATKIDPIAALREE